MKSGVQICGDEFSGEIKGGGVLVTAGEVLNRRSDFSQDPDESLRPSEVAAAAQTHPAATASKDAGTRRITAPRVISTGGTGGKRSRGVYCVQLAPGSAQQSGGSLTDDGLLASIRPASVGRLVRKCLDPDVLPETRCQVSRSLRHPVPTLDNPPHSGSSSRSSFSPHLPTSLVQRQKFRAI